MKAMRRRIAPPKRLRREMFIGSEVFSKEAAPRKRGARTSKRPRSRLRPRSTVTGYTDIMDGRKTGVAELHPPLLSLPAPMEGRAPASPCVPRRRRAPPSNESEERTPKERLVVKTFALGEGAASEPAGATEQVVSSYALAFLEECGFHRHAPIRAQPRTTTREFAGRF